MFVWIKRGFFSLAILGLLFTGAAQAQNGQGRGNGAGSNVVDLRAGQVIPGQYIVVLHDDVADPATVANEMALAHGLGLGHVYSHALKGFSATLPAGAVAGLSRDPRVDYIEADQVVHADVQDIPTGIQRIFADSNTNLTIDGSDDVRIDVDVAVIDTGIDLDHPDLNVVGAVSYAGGAGDDGNGHGTHVAGSIGALDNGIGVVGVAPGARLWAVKVLNNGGSGSYANVIAGIDYVTAHADEIEVANMSLGGGHSNAVCNAVANSVAAGVVHVVAAGNSDTDAAGHSPADCDGVVTVSALADFDGLPGGSAAPTCRSDEDDTLANFSNYGALVEIAAPGVCITSTWKGGVYNTISGTSMASPHVAGAAALLAASGIAAADIPGALTDNGNSGWAVNNDDPDGVEEPILDVSNMDVFAPATVPSVGEVPLANATPVVDITSPGNNNLFASGVMIDFTGTANDAEEGDLTIGLAWTANSASIGSGGNFQAMLSDGSYTITAEVADLDGATGSSSVNITVGDPPAAITVSVLGPITCVMRGGKNSNKHVDIPVTVVDGDGIPIGDATVSVTVTRNGGPFWSGGGLTVADDGTVIFGFKNADSGTYVTVVTGVTGSGIVWDDVVPPTNEPSCTK